MELDELMKRLIIAGYICGYEQGHHDTVESQYTDSEEAGKEWLKDALDDGSLAHTAKQIKEI